MINQSRKKIFIATAAMWVCLLGGIIGYYEWTIITGKEVLLKLRPVDPRDLFRGDYVVLNYDISNVSASTVHMGTAPVEGVDIYASLDVSSGLGVVTAIESTKPKAGIFIQGTVQRVSHDRLTVRYGIESFFVPEGRGREFERITGRGLSAKVAIDNSGGAVIKGLVVDGKDFSFAQ